MLNLENVPSNWRSLVASGAIVLLAGPSLADGEHCEDMFFDIAFDGAPATIFAKVCGRDPDVDAQPIQILLHGGAYDHRYWDAPYRPEVYSYVRAATARGYVTVNLDRLGYGQSTRPDGRELTFEKGAKAVVAVIDQIEAGALGTGPGAIVLNGHSMGGIVAEIVAGADHRVDALIVSGLANTPDEGAADDDEGGPPAGPNPFIPASSDPRFASAGWAGGYMTTAPGARPHIFHAPGTTEDAIAGVEDDLTDTIAMAELRSVMSGGTPSEPFDSPSLYVLGQYDVIACGGEDCTQRFSGTDWHTVIEGAGHSINLSTVAPEFFALTFNWLETQGLAP